MKKKTTVVLAAVLFLITAVLGMSAGFYSSSSAVQDLKAELETIYGAEYTGKAVETGTENMTFMVKPKSWFLTNWNLRNALGLDYKYECQVVFTTSTEENTTKIRTITYQGIDPMGAADAAERAYLKPDSKKEKTEVRQSADTGF